MTKKNQTPKIISSKEKPQIKKDDNKKPKEEKVDPTKYGDWQVNGRAIDF